MHSLRLCAVAVFAGIALSNLVDAAETDPKILELQGTWQLESIEQSGEKLDDKKVAGRVMLIGGRNAFIRQGGVIVQVALMHLNSAGDKSFMNIAVLQGQDAGAIFLGIYQLKDDVLKICYDSGGVERPAEFKAAADTKQVLAVYKKRAPRPTDRKDITGHFKTTTEADAGNTVQGDAIIEKHGDGYSVIYKQGAGVAYIGVGVREGDTFSVTWRNQLQTGLSVYKIGADRKMNGKYLILGGNGAVHNESLHPDNEF